MNESEVTRRVMSGLRWTVAMRMLGQVINWVMTIVVIRYVRPEDYGLKSMADVAIGLIAVFSTSGMEAAIIQVKDLTSEKIASIFGFLLLINGLLFSVLVIGAYPLSTYYGDARIVDLVHVMALGFLLVPFNAIPSAITGRNMEYRLLSTVSLVTNIVGAMTTLALAVCGFGVWALATGPLVSALLNAIMLNFRVRALVWPRFAISEIREMAVFGGTIVLTSILWIVFSRADVFIGGRLLTPAEVGLYAVALQWAALPIDKLIPMVNQVAFPAYSRLRDDKEAVRRHFLLSVRVASILMFPVAFGIAAIAHPLIPLVIGDAWAPVATLLMMQCLLTPFRAISMLFAPMTNAMGKPQIQLKLTALGTATMVPGYIVGAHYGPTGLILVWLIVYPWVMLANVFSSVRLIDLSAGAVGRAISRPLLYSTVMLIVLLGLQKTSLAHQHPATQLAVLIPIGGLIYVSGMYLADKQRLWEALRLLRRR